MDDKMKSGTEELTLWNAKISKSRWMGKRSMDEKWYCRGCADAAPCELMACPLGALTDFSFTTSHGVFIHNIP
jgi:Fe-S-cluster-containing hydrogenase component 2